MTTPRKTALKIADATAKQKAVARLTTRERLARTLGPQMAYVTAPYSGETILVVRPDIVALATNKDWPQPLTAAARTLITEGDAALKTPERIEKYLDLQHRAIVALARVEPPELIEARALDEEAWEADKAEWDRSHRAALAAKDEATLSALTAAMPTQKTAHRDAALALVDPDTLKPLFVMPGDEPDDDQLILLRPGDGQSPDAARGEFRFHMNDLYSLMGQLMTIQAGGLLTFRR